MKCPACGNGLATKMVGDVELDVCDGGCGGIWFDTFELNKFDERHEEVGSLLEIHCDADLHEDRSRRHYCPNCTETVMARHFFSVKHEVEIDECPRCGGIWLDRDELEILRSLFATEEARRQAGRDDFAQEFGAELAAMAENNEARLQQASRFANMFRFICPTHYIPGKQKWGAF